MSTLRAIALGRKCCRAIAIWLTIDLALCIGALTLIPLRTPSGVPGTDKAHHVLAFAILTVPCAALYPKRLLRVVFATAFYGGVIEVIQPYVGRHGETADVLADLLGVAIGAAFGLLLNMIFKWRIARRSAGLRRCILCPRC
ncbi:VanZ family protein [Sulfitobacter sp.]|uniref:VanZ family protein n=1 Tax=Sulfitobacter sp. TaxID=1903071 RepID=UPI00261BFEE1|nr:VanZ family protein [Sulfitobacter sp.]